VPSAITTWASKVSPAATFAGTPTVTLVTAAAESVKVLEPTKVIAVEGVAVAVGVMVAVGVTPCCTLTVIEAVPKTVPAELNPFTDMVWLPLATVVEFQENVAGGVEAK
jgi:hypothetical protein